MQFHFFKKWKAKETNTTLPLAGVLHVDKHITGDTGEIVYGRIAPGTHVSEYPKKQLQREDDDMMLCERCMCTVGNVLSRIRGFGSDTSGKESACASVCSCVRCACDLVPVMRISRYVS
jgi:hypothetical protein